mmetsp:Transcript_104638/g.197114  ORF Transcript_104638/g.197114 Transcript_104638/m.197114 type:complete len:205 (+) Transcript_104638:56-670(+)
MAAVAAICALRQSQEHHWQSFISANARSRHSAPYARADASQLYLGPSRYEAFSVLDDVQLGQVIALHSRTSGGNGTFSVGDVGEASQQLNGLVQIVWPNGSRSHTEWPNAAWYRGRPHMAHRGFHSLDREEPTSEGRSYTVDGYLHSLRRRVEGDEAESTAAGMSDVLSEFSDVASQSPSMWGVPTFGHGPYGPRVLAIDNPLD